jgi:hypothetical protein
MSYYEQNIESLKKYRNEIHEKLNDIHLADSKNRHDQIYTETTINGEKILFVQKDGILCRLNSYYNPTHEAKIWSEQFELSNLNTVITMFGLGNGIFVNKLAERLKKEDFLFIFEPSYDVFDYVLKNYDITKIIENQNICIKVEGLNDFYFHNLLQNAVNISNLYSQIQCSHPGYNELFRESCVSYWKEIRDIMFHTRLNINTEIIFGERLILNSCKNMKYIKDSNTIYDIAEEICNDVPAIIVAAGPSLKDNLEELKRAEGKAYIFVIDRILDYVLDYGIKPDFVVTIDPSKPVELFTEREDVKIPLLTEMSSNWEVLDRHKGRKVFYSCSPYFQKMYLNVAKKPPIIYTGGSVATAAFSLCIQMGFKKIVLVGQDLAYDGDFTHAGGIKEKFEDGSHDFMVEGVDGNLVRSRYDWYEFITWFNDMIELSPNIIAIDTKKKGAKIKGTVLMSLKEVIDIYGSKDIDIEQAVREKKSTFNDQEYHKIRKFFRDSCDELNALKRKSKEAISLCNRQITEYKRNHVDTDFTIKNFKKISRINKYINEKPTYSLLDSFITSMTANYISKLYQFSDDTKTDKVETYEKSLKIYEAIILGVDFALPTLKKELEQLDNE